MERNAHGIMKRELEHFYIGQDYGANQDILKNFVLRMGGCAAVTACDTCICLDRSFGTHFYPYDRENVTQEEYELFLTEMKPYLRPRMSGIDRLEIYQEGFAQFMRDRGEGQVKISCFEGTCAVSEAEEIIVTQIDRGFPIPYLMLRHRDKELDDFIWHWFLLNGYEKTEGGLQVKATSYGEWKWFSLTHLWNTGFERRGGMILLSENEYGGEINTAGNKVEI